MNNISILEIRKNKFIENPDYYNYQKLMEKTSIHKEIFDNKFFADATRTAISNRDNIGLLYISKLYILLNRYIEAEYILFRALEIDNNDDDILYWLFDILCRRKQLGFLSSFGEKLEKLKNELMYLKSLIKYLILTNKTNELENLFTQYFEKYKSDKEFVWFIFTSAIRENNYRFTYMVSKTIFQNDLFSNLNKSEEISIKSHFYLMIIKILKEDINDHKNS